MDIFINMYMCFTRGEGKKVVGGRRGSITLGESTVCIHIYIYIYTYIHIYIYI